MGWWEILRASGIITLLAALIFFIIKYELVKWVMIEDGQRGLRVRFGVPVINRRTGEFKVLTPGGKKYFYLKGIHGIAVVNIRDERSSLGLMRLTHQGRNIWLTAAAKWHIRDDPKSIRDSVFNVKDANHFNPTNVTLEQLVVSYTKEAITQLLPGAAVSDSGLPFIGLTLAGRRQLEEKLGQPYGIEVTDLICEEIAFAPEEPLKDGLAAIADAIRASGVSHAPLQLPPFRDVMEGSA